jgi:multiple sugar transport system substrate-binding protein
MFKQMANGGLYALPVAMQPSPLIYNKDIFYKFGIAYPKGGITWNETYELSNILTRSDGGVDYRGLFVSIGLAYEF